MEELADALSDRAASAVAFRVDSKGREKEMENELSKEGWRGKRGASGKRWGNRTVSARNQKEAMERGEEEAFRNCSYYFGVPGLASYSRWINLPCSFEFNHCKITQHENLTSYQLMPGVWTEQTTP